MTEKAVDTRGLHAWRVRACCLCEFIGPLDDVGCCDDFAACRYRSGITFRHRLTERGFNPCGGTDSPWYWYEPNGYGPWSYVP